jgi:hypothetical protein
MKILAISQLCKERSPESNNPSVKSQKFDHFSLFSDRSVHNWLIVANTFIRKSTYLILLRVLTSLYGELEIGLELCHQK